MTPVILSGRGIIHRRQPNGALHARCSGGRGTGVGLTAEQAARYAEGRPAVLCRYRWCFRDAVRAAGFDPEVGHFIRDVRRPSLADIAALLTEVPS